MRVSIILSSVVLEHQVLLILLMVMFRSVYTEPVILEHVPDQIAKFDKFFNVTIHTSSFRTENGSNLDIRPVFSELPNWLGMTLLDPVEVYDSDSGAYRSYSVQVSGEFAYLASERYGFVTMNISDESSPTVVSVFPTYRSNDVVVQGDYAFIADDVEGLKIVDISTRTVPNLLFRFDTERAVGLFVEENYAYIADSEGGMIILDITIKNLPIQVSSIGDFNCLGVFIVGNLAYVVDDNGMGVINVTQKSSPVFVSQVPSSYSYPSRDYGGTIGIFVSGSYGYVADYKKPFQIYDISTNVSNPTVVGDIASMSSCGVTVLDIYAYVATGSNGLEIVDVSNKMDPTRVGGVLSGHGFDVVVSLDQTIAYLADGQRNLKIIDIRNKTCPTIVGRTDNAQYYIEVYTKFNYTYVADCSEGIKIFEIQPNSKTTSEEDGELEIQYLSGIDTYNARRVIVDDNEKYMYVSDYTGIKVVDISDKRNPSVVGEIGKVYTTEGIYYHDDTLYVADVSSGLRIFDVSNKKAPTLLSITSTNNARNVIMKGTYAYVADGSGGLLVIDVSNKFSPSIVGVGDTFNANGLYVHEEEDLVFVADWTAGVKIFDVKTKSNPVMIGENDLVGGMSYLAYDVVVVQGKTAYISVRNFGGLFVLDVSDPTDPIITNTIPFDGTPETFYLNIHDSRVYVSNGRGGMKIFSLQGILLSGRPSDTQCGYNRNLTIVATEDDGSFVTDSFNLKVVDPVYGSNRCDYYYCDSVAGYEPYVCSGNGNCTAFDNCECWLDDVGDQSSQYYFGETCELTTCNSIMSNESDVVCSGNGECVSYEECKCRNEFSGKWCGYWVCYGISASNVTFVCSNHGGCVSLDECFCFSGYFGDECNSWNCGEFHKDSPEACNERGTCVGSEFCECDDSGYLGDLCETFKCGKHFQDDALGLVCSGNGKCKSPDKCECDIGYSGNGCQTNVLLYATLFPVLGVSSFFVLILGLALFTCCLYVFLVFSMFCCCVLLGYLFRVVLHQRVGIQKFRQLKNFDILLEEQRADGDSRIAHIRVNKALFQIPMEEIKVDRILGEGGSHSVVFKVFWRNQVCAFKCFKTRFLCGKQDDFNEFEREVEVLSSISHPHVIKFFGATMKPPRVGIVMEFCENGDLDQFLEMYNEEEGVRYPYNEKMRMLSETASAVSYLHSRSIIHRDIKLENILVDSVFSCKLMDFGISRIVSKMNQKKTKRVGTSVYMAPELVIGDGHYSEKCDIFSFGILAWILLTEVRNPYTLNGFTEMTNIEMRVADNPDLRPNLEKLKEFVPQVELKWVCSMLKRTWSHDESERMSCEELFRLLTEKEKKEEEVKLFGLVVSEVDDTRVQKGKREKPKFSLRKENERLLKENELQVIKIKDLEERIGELEEKMISRELFQ